MKKSEQLLESLRRVEWDVARRTFGNDHSTLIGLIVHWWTTLLSTKNTALESGPTHGLHGKRCGHCDAVFCEGEHAVGVLEVEGGRPELTIEKIGHFFSAPEYFDSLWFAILLLYKIGPVGRGLERDCEFPFERNTESYSEVQRVSREHPNKTLIVIALHKNFRRHQRGLRGKNEYYSCSAIGVSAFLFIDGELHKQIDLKNFEPIFWQER